MQDNPYAPPASRNESLSSPRKASGPAIRVGMHHILYLVGILYLFESAAVRSHGGEDSSLLFVCSFGILVLHSYLLVLWKSRLRWTMIGGSVAFGVSGMFLTIPYFLFIVLGLHLAAAGGLYFRVRRRQRHYWFLLNSDDSVQALRDEIAKHGESVELLNYLALAYGKNKHFADAAACLRKCLKPGPGDVMVRSNLALYLAEVGEIAESAELFRGLLGEKLNMKMRMVVSSNYALLLTVSGRNSEATALLDSLESECAKLKSRHQAFRISMNQSFTEIRARLHSKVAAEQAGSAQRYYSPSFDATSINPEVD